MERIIAIQNYVVTGLELSVEEAERIVTDFMHAEERRNEQRAMLFVQSGEQERELWLRGEWDRLGDVRPFDWEKF